MCEIYFHNKCHTKIFPSYRESLNFSVKKIKKVTNTHFLQRRILRSIDFLMDYNYNASKTICLII